MRWSFSAMPPSEVTSSRPPSTRGIGLMEMKRLPALRGVRRAAPGVRRPRWALQGAQVFAWRAVAQVDLPCCDFVAMDQSAVEAQMIRSPDARTQHGNFTVDGDAAGANPLFRLAA